MTWPRLPDGSADQFERDLLDQWTAEDLFARTREDRAGGTPFVFYEGPPTANGRPGIHHVFSRTIKDAVCRFRTMQGRSVTRIAGWDTHGLPVEIEVEKRLSLSGKKDIEAFGIAEFNALCRESVFTYQTEWVALSNRIAYWLDYEHPYVTCTPEYIETVWWLLHRLHERGLLVRGHRVLPYCPRCGTVLSSHELALGYQEVRDKSVYVTMPVEGPEGWELVVWTTTPWTLPSNVAVAVHPTLEYGIYRVAGGGDGERLLIAAVDRAGAIRVGGRPLSEAPLVGRVPGRELVGRRYTRPLDVVPLPAEGRHSEVIAADFVTAEDGSGLVHLAPAFGADDHAAGQEHGLAMLRPVAADGTFTGTTWPELEGCLVTAEATTELLLRRLKTDGRHLATEQVVHSYPHCWRCRSKLIYLARDSWFVRTSAVRDRMLALNGGVSWHPPEVGARRFGDWLTNNVDWALSRNRYWGTPLPVWVCDRNPDHVDVIGSYADLAERVGPLPPDFDPHRPGIDAFTWDCPCGGTRRRTPEVIDTWFDSGAMPYAQWHYPFENREEFTTHFPADFICEGVDQTRGWFYSLLAIGAAAFDDSPYRNVIVNELILDADGQKMSKSRGNVVDPWEVVGHHGADAVRLYLLTSSQVWLPKRFDRRGIPEFAGGVLNTLRHTYAFFALYAGNWRPGAEEVTRQPIDRWLLGALDACVREVSSAWEQYDMTAGAKRLGEFIVDDLSNWYVRLNRSRFWAPDAEADPAAVSTLYTALVTVTRLLAPVCPFVSDWIHRSLVGHSVHRADFPSPAPVADPALGAAMTSIRMLASLGRSAREAGGLPVRQPLGTMRVAVPARVRGPAFDGLLELLRTEVNVRRLEVAETDTDLVRLRARPNFRALGKRFGRETPLVAARVAALVGEPLRTLESGGVLSLPSESEGAPWVIEPGDVVIEREVATEWLVQSSGEHVVAVDPVVTEDLRSEGLAREVLSRVQRLRKEASFDYDARIHLAIEADAPVLEAVRTHQALVCREALVRKLHFNTVLDPAEAEDRTPLNDHCVHLSVTRCPHPVPIPDPPTMESS